jgi:large subunit ribosomal protein L4
VAKKSDSTQINRIPLFDLTGKKVEMIELNKDTFDGKVNKALLYQTMLMYRANQRKGTANTKTRGDVRGGGKKPWRQKGTGRARAGSIRSPIWRGGGIVFGPHYRDFSYSVPKKIKRNAFISSLNGKLKSGKILALETESLDEPKTKKLAKLLKDLNIKKEKILLLVEKNDRNLLLASRNIKNLTLKRISDTTAFDILSNEHIIMSKQATEFLNRSIKQ